MLVKAIVGLGYGDEGKGLMTDYLCREFSMRVLNIKHNGGAQAGHTVCELDTVDKCYRTWVFKQFGAGSFAGADTYLMETFHINLELLMMERHYLKSLYMLEPKMYISKDCSVTLPIDILINRELEKLRNNNNHGSCGLGIYEGFHRADVIGKITIDDLVRLNNEGKLVEHLNKLSKSYLEYRVDELKEHEHLQFTQESIAKCTLKYKAGNKEIKSLLKNLLDDKNTEIISSLDTLLRREDYGEIIFESAQGLELDRYEERNFPHLTPSNTGLKNVALQINKSNVIKENITGPVEAVFITRSYKTKHGAGPFIESDKTIEDEYKLYDKTNTTNKFQGTLRYGTLDIPRMESLAHKQIELFNSMIINNNIELEGSLAITHLDQTRTGVIIKKNDEKQIVSVDALLEIDKYFSEFGSDVYLAYGEKATDIIRKRKH